MKPRIFTIRPPVWWMRFSPEWRRKRGRMERWLQAHQMEILSFYRDEIRSEYTAKQIEDALGQR